ncbi:MAG: hypothetical protein SGJ19_08580 [Planctomycetia bacterium]|nr:hypothetical protein [Planctomycetia bacterium]
MIYFKLTFAEMKAKVPNLQQSDYDREFDTAMAKAPTVPDPLIRLDRGARTLEVDYHGEDFRVYYIDFAAALKDAVVAMVADQSSPINQGGTDAILANGFGTPEAAAKKEAILDDSRAEMRKVAPKDVTNPVPPPNPNANDLDNLKAVIGSDPNGFCFGGDHADPTRHDLMERLLDEPDGGGVGMYFIEELMVVDQRLVDDFLNSPLGTPLPPALVKRIGGFGRLRNVLEKMRDKNAAQNDPTKKIKVYGINSNETKTRPGLMGGETRCVMMNLVAKEVMEQAKKDNPGKKFMAVVGAAHSNTHAGGIPGLSQLFGVPAVKLQKDGNHRLEIDVENKALRGMPTAEEMKAIEAKAAKVAKLPTEDAKRAKIHELTTKERTDLKTRYETLKEAFKEPFITLRREIVSVEQSISQDRKKGMLTPQEEQNRRQKIARLVTEMEQAKKRASDLLKAYAKDTPDVLKQKDSDDMTLLHYAATFSNEAAIAMIVQDEPSILDAKTKNGDTAAHLVLARRDFHGDALRKDLLDVQAQGLAWIVGAGANMDIKNAKGQAPLHLAALNGNGKAADDLLGRGADPNVKDTRGWTPFDVCLGSTKTEVEKAFYKNGAASPKYVPEKPKQSIVDVMVQVTKFDDPNDAVGIREMYDKMYADPLLKPILEAAAIDAMQDRDPPNEGGVRIFVSKGDSTGELFNAPSWLPTGKGAFDENANTFVLAGKQPDPRQGVMIHEMTHMITRKMYGTNTVPYDNPADEKLYRDAIANDVKNIHLLNDSDPIEARIKDRMSSRMNDYVHRGGDSQLLQEFIVGVPQMISEFGAEAVQKHCPGMMKFYKDFTAKVHNKMVTDPTLSGVHAKLDNTELDDKLAKKPPQLPTAPQDNWLKKGGGDVTVDALMTKIKAEYISRHGELNLVANTTVPFGPSSYKIKDADLTAFNNKMAKVKASLEANLNAEQLASEINPDAIRSLVAETVGIVERAQNVDDIDGMVAGRTGNWVRDSKINLVNHKLAQGKTMDPTELAEATLLLAENRALGKLGNGDPNEVVDVDPGKHKALVKSLAGDLAKKMNGLTPDKLQKLMPQLATAIVDNPKSPFSIKKKNQTADPTHVSVDKKAVKRLWLKKLKTI